MVDYKIPQDEKDQDITGGWKSNQPTNKAPLTYYDAAPHYTAAGIDRQIKAMEKGAALGAVTFAVILSLITIPLLICILSPLCELCLADGCSTGWGP